MLNPFPGWVVTFLLLTVLCVSAARAQVPQTITDCSSSDPGVAIRACSSIISDGRQTQRNRARAHYLRGRAHGKNQAHDSAIADFDAAIRLDPGNAGSFAYRAVAHGQNGNFERSIQDASEAIRLEPSNGAGYAIRGDGYLRRCDFQTALSDFETAIRLKPDLANAYIGRANSHLRNGDTDRALEDAEQAVRLQPNSAANMNTRGSIHAKRNDLDKALQDFDGALRIKADFAPAYHNRGLVFARRGDLDRAIRDFDAAIRLKADYLSALVNRGKAHQQQGAKERALADLNRALQIKRTCDEDPRFREDAQWRIAALKAEQSSPPPPPPPPPRIPPQGDEPPHQPERAKGHATRRVALVIGNEAYLSAKPLNNPVNDANAVSAALKRLEFQEVIDGRNLTRAQFETMLKAFGDKAAEADWALVYYSGHGLQVDSKNFLVPTDAQLKRVSHIGDELLGLDRILEKLSETRKLRLVILDACRDNPLAARLQQTAHLTRSIGRGLARAEGPGGVLIAYSAREGQVAEDGPGNHSPFTQALIEHIEEPGLEIGFLFRKVRDKVFKRTEHRDRLDPKLQGPQEPYTTGSLPGEPLCFKGPCREQ